VVSKGDCLSRKRYEAAMIRERGKESLRKLKGTQNLKLGSKK